MPRHKFSRGEFDVDELDVEYDKGTRYTGDIPPTGTVVLARVTKMWLTESSQGDIMFKALAVAEDGDDQDPEVGEYDGLPIWENLTMNPDAAFKYQPFVEAFPFTLKEMRDNLYIARDDDNVGAPVEKIGTWEPGSDDALCYIVTKKDRYNGQWQAKIGDILPFEEEEEEEEPPPPKRTRKAKPAAKSAPARRGRRRPEPEPEPDDEELEDEYEDEEEEEEEEERPARRTRARASANGRKRTAKSTRGRGRRAADDDHEDNPPF